MPSVQSTVLADRVANFRFLCGMGGRTFSIV
jgi:hypothetical protein